MASETHTKRYGVHQVAPPPNWQRRALLRRAAGLGIATAGGLFASLVLANELEVGKFAPPLVLQTLDGHSIATRDLLGQVVLATFWATWCEPCREELPMLSTYASNHARQGLRVLGFSLDGPEALPKVRVVAATLSFPVGLLGNPYVGGYGRIWRIPVSFVIDRAGRLAHNGWDDDEQPLTKEQLQRVVDPLLLRAA
jgi:cytochrome c biogenesis protein CcmG, thiol:disulfide interchange protein DsbE